MTQVLETTVASVLGARVDGPGGGLGFVSAIMKPETAGFVIGAGMARILEEYEVVWDSGRISTMPDHIAAPMLARAAGLPRIPAEEIPARRAAAAEAMEATRQAAARAQNESVERRAAFMADAAKRVPADAKAVIVAELVEDRSDSMTDYYGSTTTRTVILGFSTHTRDLFPELRKAARNFAETASLADAPANAEHRQKYSMGGGFFLKAGYRHDNGWKVSKQRLFRGIDSLPVAEWSLEPVAPPTSAGAAVVEGVSIERHTHTKGGFDMWVVVMPDRVSRDDFDRLRGEAQTAGGWYSRKWGASPAGFAFKSEEAAKAFAGGLTSGPADSADTPKAAPSSGTATAEKLRAAADRLQSEIDSKFATRRTNTPKQQREAASARLDGLQLQRTQQGMRALASHHDAGTVPTALHGVTTKAALLELARAEIERSGGYYDAGRDLGRPAKETPATLAFWSLLAAPTDEQRQADLIREKVEAVRFMKIDGYFPTPAPLVAEMIEAAKLPDGPCDVMEPEAGSAAILDAIKAAAPSANLIAFEHHVSLRAVLEAKGYTLTGADFMESDPALKVDRVLMNPPFERGQDMAHVRRAFDHLRPGGRLVAILSPGPFFRQDAKAVAFREWFEALGGERRDIAAGAFKDSGTGVATVMVTLDREG